MVQRRRGEGYWPSLFRAHLAAAAFFATSERFLADIFVFLAAPAFAAISFCLSSDSFAARAFPPILAISLRSSCVNFSARILASAAAGFSLRATAPIIACVSMILHSLRQPMCHGVVNEIEQDDAPGVVWLVV